MRIRTSIFSTVPLLLVLACSGGTPTPANTAENAPAGGGTGPEPEPVGGGGEETAEGGGEAASGGEEGSGEASGDGEDERTTTSIAEVIKAHRKPIRACYDKARKSLPDLKGKMTIHFVLDPEGKVKKAELNQERSDIKSPEVVDCALAQIKNLKFPPSSKGMDTTVNYPFDFKPDGGG